MALSDHPAIQWRMKTPTLWSHPAIPSHSQEIFPGVPLCFLILPVLLFHPFFFLSHTLSHPLYSFLGRSPQAFNYFLALSCPRVSAVRGSPSCTLSPPEDLCILW